MAGRLTSLDNISLISSGYYMEGFEGRPALFIIWVVEGLGGGAGFLINSVGEGFGGVS